MIGRRAMSRTTVKMAARPCAGQDAARATAAPAHRPSSLDTWARESSQMHQTVILIRNRATREALPRLIRPDVRDDLVRLGSDYGGWWVPAADVKPDVVAYCAGAG